jgi:4-amino-4-deoxy-L-arabinose transferase-like glycosyltransferase
MLLSPGSEFWESRLVSSGRRIFPFLALGVVIWLTCFSALRNSNLIDEVDEGLYSTASRQMIDSGDWVIPRVGTEIFLEKPPLFYWSQAIFIRLLGPTPLAARLPSAIATALTALILLWWARRRGQIRVGVLAATLYLLCPLTFGLAQLAMMDSLLTLWLTLAAVAWIESYLGNRRTYLPYLLWAAACALACMTKGLIGLLLPGAAFVIWLIVRRDPAELRRVPWLAIAGVFLLVVLPWHMAVWRSQGGKFLQEYLLRQQFQRFLGTGFNQSTKFWYYLAVLPFAMFPWSVFVPAAWWQGLRSARRSPKPEVDCAAAMWALWVLVILVFFSVSRTRLPQYLLPALPALSVLVAMRLEAAWRNRRSLSRAEAVGLAVNGFVFAASYVTVFVLGWRLRAQQALSLRGIDAGAWLVRESPILTILAPQWLALGIVTLLGTLLMLLWWRKVQTLAVVSILTAAMVAVIILHSARPAWNRQQIDPLIELGQRTVPALERGEHLILYEANKPTPYGLRYRLAHPEQISEVLLRHKLPPVLNELQHGYVLAPRKAIFYPSPVQLHQEAVAGSWILWRFDRER